MIRVADIPAEGGHWTVNAESAKEVGSTAPQTPWQSIAPAAACAYGQLYLFHLNRETGHPSAFLLAIGSAILFSVAIALVPPESYLPVLSSLHKAQKEPGVRSGLRTSYALMGLTGYLGGCLFEQIYPWVLNTGIAIVSSLLVQPGEEPDLSMGLDALTSRTTLLLLGASLGWVALNAAVETWTLRWGSRGRLHSIYGRHTKAKMIAGDEQVFRRAAMCSGLTFAMGLNSLVLILVGVGFARLLGPGELLARDERVMPELARTRRVVAMDTFIASGFWIPLADPTSGPQFHFLVLLWIPFLSLIPLGLLRPPSIPRFRLLAIRVVSVASLVGAAWLQLVRPVANPMLSYIAVRFPQNSPPPLEIGQLLTVLCAWALIHQALRVCWNGDSDPESAVDALRAYRAYKLEMFVALLSLRIAMLTMFLISVPLDHKRVGSFVVGIVAWIAALSLPTRLQPDGAAARKRLRELREHFSDTQVRQSLVTSAGSLRRVMLWRDVFNLVSIFAVGGLAFVQSHPVLRIASLPVVVMVLLCYYAVLIDETVLSIRYLSFDRGIGIVDSPARWTVARGWSPK